MVDEVTDSFLAGRLPPALACSEPSISDVPTMVTFILFVEWGREPAHTEPGDASGLRKYYIVANNAGVGADLSDIQACGGSAAAYLGEWLGVSADAWWQSFALPLAVPSFADAAARQRSVVCKIGYGTGIVTEEAWMHPEVR
jgi:hypothetical protein